MTVVAGVPLGPCPMTQRVAEVGATVSHGRIGFAWLLVLQLQIHTLTAIYIAAAMMSVLCVVYSNPPGHLKHSNARLSFCISVLLSAFYLSSMLQAVHTAAAGTESSQCICA